MTHGFVLASDGGSSEGKGTIHEKNSALHVQLAGCWQSDAPRARDGPSRLTPAAIACL